MNMKKIRKINRKNREAMHKLLDVVIDAQNKGLCGFYDFSGHVYWVSVRICESVEEYNTDLYRKDFILLTAKDTPENIEIGRKEIRAVIKNAKEEIKKAEQRDIEAEKKLLVELKDKYK